MKRAFNKIYHMAGGLLFFLGFVMTYYGAAMIDTADINAGTRYAVCGLCVLLYGAFLAKWNI